MKFKDIKKQIKNEIDAHSPSFESVLSKCKQESTENLQKVVWDQYSRTEEKALLYQLFELTP